jgi:hypothetical protein
LARHIAAAAGSWIERRRIVWHAVRYTDAQSVLQNIDLEPDAVFQNPFLDTSSDEGLGVRDIRLTVDDLTGPSTPSPSSQTYSVVALAKQTPKGNVDVPRLRIGWGEQHLARESLGCRSIAFGREQEIDGLPCGIHGAIQISVPFDPDVGFIDAIASIGLLQVSAAALVQFRPVDLDPAPDATGMEKQTAFERHLGHVRK